ncbi:ABC transporter permease [Solihabitans fulvus]|nr:ABC transporter permease [Solihabitans fulvus]
MSGRLRSALIIGGQGIRARKLRTFLSMISLFLGVLAVVIVQAGSEIVQRASIADIELQSGKDGTHQMYVGGQDPGALTTALDTVRDRPDAVALSSGKAVIGEPNVTPINPGGSSFDNLGSRPGRVDVICDQTGCYPDPSSQGAPKPNGKAIELRLNAMTGDVRQFKPYRQESGQWLDFASAPSLAPRIVLNKKAAVGFARYQVPAQLHIDGGTSDPTPQIVGVVDDGSYQPEAYVRVDELTNWLPAGGLGSSRGSSLQVLMSPGAADLEQTLRARLVAAGMKAEQININVVQSKQRIESQLALMRWIFLGMAALVLLIGVAGILNVGLATVGERVEEFALRRAVGTPRMLLAGIVLAETLLTGLITAAAAIGASALALRAAPTLAGGRGASYFQDLTFPWQAGVAGVIAGLVAGLLGGAIPAIRAARIPIATVMRA